MTITLGLPHKFSYNHPRKSVGLLAEFIPIYWALVIKAELQQTISHKYPLIDGQNGDVSQCHVWRPNRGWFLHNNPAKIPHSYPKKCPTTMFIVWVCLISPNMFGEIRIIHQPQILTFWDYSPI